VYARAEVCSGARPAVERAGGFGRVETKCQVTLATLMASKGGYQEVAALIVTWPLGRGRGLGASRRTFHEKLRAPADSA
jgi:hypothetical protein